MPDLVDGLYARAMLRLRGVCPHAWAWDRDVCRICHLTGFEIASGRRRADLPRYLRRRWA